MTEGLGDSENDNAYADDAIAESAAVSAEMLRAVARRWRDRAAIEEVPARSAEALRLAANLEQAAVVIERGEDIARVRRRAEAAADDGRLRLLVDSITDYAIFALDPDGRVATWNTGAQRILGYEAGEIVGRHFSVFCTREDVDAGRPLHELEIAARTGRYAEEGWRRRKSGQLFWTSIVITALRDPVTKELRGFAKITRDLSDRRQAEDLLRKSEERLRLLVESVKDYAILMLDPQGSITTWNGGAERINGYRADEVLGRHFSLFYQPEDIAAGRPRRELEIATAVGRYEEEGWRVRRGGERYWVNVVLTAIRDPVTQELRGFAKVTRDLTERRAMEDEARAVADAALRDRAKAVEAQNALALRDEFISVAAHELRTPLTALQLKVEGVNEALKTPGPAAKVMRMSGRLESALRQIERLTGLVERLLDVSRIVRGQLALNREDTDLVDLAAEVVEDFRAAAQQSGSELTLHAGDSVIGQWDRGRLAQVLINLISNAIKYGAGRPIDVLVVEGAEDAQIVVADHGIGIDGKDLDRIFGRFERAAPAGNYSGLGVGLYVARSIVEQHGGQIDVVSQPGEGSTFTIRLPKRGAAVAGDRAVAAGP